MKKELKDYLHLYLGAKLRWQYYDYEEDCISIWQTLTASILNNIISDASVSRIDIALRPLSSMSAKEAKEMSVQGIYNLVQVFGEKCEEISCTSEQFKELLFRHFDLYGLIEAGLAIDKTTLK